MSTATEVTQAPDEPLISDDSRIPAERKGIVTKLVNGILALIPEAITLGDKLDGAYGKVATNRCKIRAEVILADKEPDWAGTSQTYKQAVNRAERDVLDSYSDAQVSRFQNNVRSHIKRTALAPVILDWVRANISGCDTAPDDSPKLASEMRRQYGRAKLAVPDKWRETPPNGSGPGADAIKDTPTSKVDAAAIALTTPEMSTVEAVGHVHRMASAIGNPAVQPNAEVRGGKKLTGDAFATLGRYCLAVASVLTDSNLTGDAYNEAIAKVEKYSHQG